MAWPCFAATALAQAVPNAATLMNNIDQGLKAQQSLAQVKKAYPPAMSLKTGDPATYEFDSIQVQGNTILNQVALDIMAQAAVGMPISASQIKSVTRQIERFYKEAGVDAWAYVPQQELSSHRLVIQVIEHKLDPEGDPK